MIGNFAVLETLPNQVWLPSS